MQQQYCSSPIYRGKDDISRLTQNYFLTSHHSPTENLTSTYRRQKLWGRYSICKPYITLYHTTSPEFYQVEEGSRLKKATMEFRFFSMNLNFLLPGHSIISGLTLTIDVENNLQDNSITSHLSPITTNHPPSHNPLFSG